MNLFLKIFFGFWVIWILWYITGGPLRDTKYPMIRLNNDLKKPELVTPINPNLKY